MRNNLETTEMARVCTKPPVAKTGRRRRILLAATVLALSVGVTAHVLHVGQHAGHEMNVLDGALHWLRDSILAIPLAALVVVAGDLITRLGATTRPTTRRMLWASLVGLGYSLALIPGGLAHGILFPAERHDVGAVLHAVSDAAALLPTALYTALALAFFMGTPSERTWPVAAALRAARSRKPTRRSLAQATVVATTVVMMLPALPASAHSGSSPADGTESAVADESSPDTYGAPQETSQGAQGAQGVQASETLLGTCARTITADVVALDQPFYYNRLGAINANGMIYALARDVVVSGTNQIVSDLTPSQRAGIAGQVSVRADKRARPLTLRANEGDCLDLTFTNLLDPTSFSFNLPGTFPTGQILGLGVPIGNEIDDQPLTREASIHIDGLELVQLDDPDRDDISSDGSNVGRNGDRGDGLVAPGETTSYKYSAVHKGTHLLYSMGATLGAEGNGGTRSYGLFGAVNVQPGPDGAFAGSDWYRSQLTREELDWAASAWLTDESGNITGPSPGNVPVLDGDGNPRVVTTSDGQPLINYHAVYPQGTAFGKGGLPIVKILHGTEIVHSDLNAIIDDRGYPYPANLAYPNRGDEPFREFTVIFHDEAFGVQAFPGFYNDPVLKHTLHGVRDSFPINYGSGGIGSEIIANRLGVGPMWDCAECKYEEFFLTSFTVGDPAMIVDIPANTTDGAGNIIPGAKATKALYPDDPSNVHHAYLGDRVVFRNLHAGPKEHHIFHLHAHQWQFNPDDPQSNYLDGQALGPGSGYSYEIAYGGSGNRNLTAGDSIFHCHFYPHFAQGMWELWRVHDTFERGTVMDIDPTDGLPIPRAGSRALPDGEIVAGTPIPAVVPMPGIAMAPMPDPAATIVPSDLNGDDVDDSSQFDANGDGTADVDQMSDLSGATQASNPGYPWYTPGSPGCAHRHVRLATRLQQGAARGDRHRSPRGWHRGRASGHEVP
jgi:hypothetical protein